MSTFVRLISFVLNTHLKPHFSSFTTKVTASSSLHTDLYLSVGVPCTLHSPTSLKSSFKRCVQTQRVTTWKREKNPRRQIRDSFPVLIWRLFPRGLLPTFGSLFFGLSLFDYLGFVHLSLVDLNPCVALIVPCVPSSVCFLRFFWSSVSVRFEVLTTRVTRPPPFKLVMFLLHKRAWNVRKRIKRKLSATL